jgi:hypothetical protein
MTEHTAKKESLITPNALIINSEPIIGTIEQDDNENYDCAEYLLNYNYTQANFDVGDTIQIKEFQYNGNAKTNIFYPKFALKFSML